jgi:hypothetical protein
MSNKKIVVDQKLFNEMVAFIGNHERCDDKDEYWPRCAECGVSTRHDEPHADDCRFALITEHPEFFKHE